MIAPRNSLLLLTAAVYLPLSLGYVLWPETLPALFAAMLAWALLAALDAALAPRRARTIRATLPEVVRLTKDRPGEIPLLLHNESGNAQSVDIGLALPFGLESGPEVRNATCPAKPADTRFDWPCTPRQRGRYVLENVYLQTRSPLGFWDFRRVAPGKTEIRVYPNLQSERKGLSAIFLNRGNLGIHAQRQVGKGRDFEQLREYIAGDSFEDIHWKATARRAHPVTKVYQLERTQEVYVIIDSSRLSARSTFNEETGTSESQLERFITAALTLGLVAEKQSDLFGLLTFSDQVNTFIRAGGGRAHYNAARDALYALLPRQVNPDFAEVCTFLRLRLRRRALLIFLTNLDDPVLAEAFAEDLRVLTPRHLVLVNAIRPPEVGPVFAEPVDTADDVYERLGGHLQWRDLRELQRGLHRQGVSMALLDNASLTPELVAQYVNVKQRQLL